MDDCSSDDDWSDSDVEGDEAEAIHALSDPSPSSRLVTVAAHFLILAIGLGIIPINNLVGRLQREARNFLRYSDLYQDMSKTWPTFSPEVRDQFYSATFRVDQNTFERILLEVQVNLLSLHEMFSGLLVQACCTADLPWLLYSCPLAG